MIASTNAVAKIAAVVAGLGLVAMSFAVAVPAKAASVDELQAQINALLAQIASLQGGSSSSVTFTMDLTIGSTGSEVTALQNFLMSHGQTIAAGATGYFGTQTQAALAAWQAANGVSPAAGYFGPITRAKVNGMGGGSTGSTGSTGNLSGGEADLHNFDLVGGDDLMEGDTNVEIALAKFDVDGGDAEIQRVTVDFQAVSTSAGVSQKPWDFIDTLSVYDGSKKVGEVDAGSKGDWDKESDDTAHNGASVDFYTIDIPVKTVVEDGDRPELSIRADAQSTIDTDDQAQTFKVQVPTDGVRAVDSQGIQQYTGDGEEITLGFDAAENGDLTVKKSSDNPDAGILVADDTTTSDEFDVLGFDIKNSDNADAVLTDLTISVATTSAVGSSAADITDIIRKATLTVNGDTFSGDIQSDQTIDWNDIEVDLPGDDTTGFMLSVELFSQSGHYASTGESLTFTLTGNTTNVVAEGSDTGDASTVSGTASGETQNIVLNGGISVTGTSQSAVTSGQNDTLGTFTVKFDITAVGDDVYIPKIVASSTASTTAGAVYNDDLSDTMGPISSGSLTTTADTDTGTGGVSYIVHDGDKESFTLTVTLDPAATGQFSVGLDQVRFSLSNNISAANLTTLDVDQNDSDFKTDPLTISGS